MGKVLDKDTGNKLRETLEVLKNKFKPKSCKFCGDEIVFKDFEGKPIPHDNDGTPHWLTCPYGKAMKKKLAPQILRKLAVFMVVKLGTGFEEEAGLTKKEAQVVHSILEYAFKETSERNEATDEPTLPVDDDGLAFAPISTDPIGDPDEDRAATEEEIQSTDPKEFIHVEDTSPKE